MDQQKLIVTIPRDANGNAKHDLIKISNKDPKWCGILVKSTTTRASRTKSGSFVIVESSRASYVQMQTEVARKLNLHEGMDLNSFGLNLTIARKETREPQYEGHQPKVNPKTGEVILEDGAPVYMNDYVAPAGTEDALIKSSSVSQEVTAPVAEAGAIS